MKEIVIMNGAPMSGKGSASKDLATNFQMLSFSTGAVYNTLKDQAEEPGPTVKGHLERGELIPDQLHIPIFVDLWWPFLVKNWGKGIVLDGAIRSTGQVQALLPLVQMMSRRYDIVQVVVKPTLKELWRRFRIVSAGNDPNRQGRIDDRDEKVFRTRLREYDEITKPSIEAIRLLGVKTIEVLVEDNRPKLDMIMKVRAALGLPLLVAD